MATLLSTASQVTPQQQDAQQPVATGRSLQIDELASVANDNPRHRIPTSSAYSSQREAYFDGSAKLILRSFVSVHRHSGLSFKTCEPGRLFEQRIEPLDSIGLSVDHEGLVFIARVKGRRLEARLNARLLDNTWYNVNLVFRLGNLTLSAAGHAQVTYFLNEYFNMMPRKRSLCYDFLIFHFLQIVANATYNSEILALPDHNVNGTLIIGEGFRGCILQGPGILFNGSINNNALFGECPLDTRGCKLFIILFLFQILRKV